MYRDDYFYILTDIMHYNVYASLLTDDILKEEHVIIKVFKKGEEVVVIETNNFVDTILMDNRSDKNSDLMEFDLVYLKCLDRYYSDKEIPGMVYEKIDDLGVWFRVKIEGFNPDDKDLNIFYGKKIVTLGDIERFKDDAKYEKLIRFFNITKGLYKFSNPNKVKKLFSTIVE